MVQSWYLDERAHAGPEHLDAGYVSTYDAKAQTDPADDLRLLSVTRDTTIVDLGSGTGTFALAAAPLCERVVAVDISPQMLAELRRKRDKQGIGNVDVVEAGFLSYEHLGDAVDVVYSRHALHHLPDFWKAIALRRIHRMLKPGGVFLLRDLIYSFNLEEADEVIESWLAGAAASPEAGWTRQELETHLQDEYSPFSWLLKPMLTQAGFEIEQTIVHRPVHATYRCRKP